MAENKAFEFTNAVVHVGWLKSKPVYIAFSLEMAKTVFEEFRGPLVICVVPPHAVTADCLEKAVHFFEDDLVETAGRSFVFAM